MLNNLGFYLCILILDAIPLMIIIFNRTTVFKTIISIIISLLIAFLLTVALYCYENKGLEKWNNGYCPECGNPWRFASANTYKCETSYTWTCDNCHTILTLHRNPME